MTEATETADKVEVKEISAEEAAILLESIENPPTPAPEQPNQKGEALAHVTLVHDPQNLISNGKQNINILYLLLFGAIARKYGHNGEIRISGDDIKPIILNSVKIIADGPDFMISHGDEKSFLEEQVARHEADVVLLKARLAEMEQEKPA